MASEYEFEGKTKEEALSKACEELGIAEDQLEFEVLSYGSTGIFGLVGLKKARIKVTLPESVAAAVQQRPSLPAEEKEETQEKEDKDDTHEDLTQISKGTLEKLISFIVDDAVVSAKTEDDILRLTIEGGNSALLIGKHGRTLDALQYIVQRIVQKKKKTRVRISVDVEGYRDRRKASLTQLALRLSEKVKRSGKPATISPMNAYDRRTIHIALKEHAGVKTQSTGTGTLRKLVIYPQRKEK